MLPLALLLPLTVVSGITTGYQIGTTILQYKEKVKRNDENKRWWNDYLKNTGLSAKDIRYPYKAGFMDSYITDLSLAYEGTQFISDNIHRLYR